MTRARCMVAHAIEPRASAPVPSHKGDLGECAFPPFLHSLRTLQQAPLPRRDAPPQSLGMSL